MKNLVMFLVFAVFSTMAFADYGQIGRSAQDDATGTLQPGSLEKFFINVKNTSGGSVADGTVFCQETTQDDGYSVTTCTAAGSVPVCVLAKSDASACADDEVCKCQTYGLNAGVLFDLERTPATAGNLAFISENSAGYVQAEYPANYAASDWPVGVFLDNASATGDVELFIRLR